MKKKKDTIASLSKEELQKQLKRKNSAMKRLKRELKIEASLEQVRARTMAMQKSDELTETSLVLFQQFKDLGETSEQISIGIFKEHENIMELYSTLYGSQWKEAAKVDLDEPVVMKKIHTAWKEQYKSLVIDIADNDLLKYNAYRKKLSNLEYKEERWVIHIAFFSKGVLTFSTTEPHPPETIQLLERFAGVFDQTYTRFLDLQKAEAQAREAQIEAALEKVRSRTMAMHKSDELAEAAAVLFKQLSDLGNEPARISIGIPDESIGMVDFWVTDQAGDQIKTNYRGRLDEPTSISKIFKGLKARQKSSIIDLQGKEFENWVRYCREEMGVTIKSELLRDRRVHNVAYFSHGWLNMSTNEPISIEIINLLERFAAVFNLTYTRFLDLQTAEAQAREATIEASLERVRGSAMAMHNSNDISSTTTIVFEELRKLNIQSKRCGVALLTKDSYTGNIYAAATSSDGKFHTLRRSIDMTQHQSLKQQYESWKEQKNYVAEMKGDELRSYYQLPFFYSSPDYIPPKNYDQSEYGYYIPFSEGLFYAWTDVTYSDDEINILNRFNRIVDLTFRRYFDLQKSEASAKEAIKQAALDRIRADIASMRTISDLDRIIPLIWKELTILGVPFIRCGVFIMDEAQKLIHTFLSTPDGKAIAAFHLPYTTPGNIARILDHWQNKKNYIDHWDEKAFTEFAYTLVQQGALTSPEQYLSTLPRGGFYLHFLPFLQGMLYVGNATQLSEDEIKLLQSVADAFSTAYARYEDFNKLEAAKQQVDKALVDLKQAQTQLIQSEKMASLGELTAGIAHEIQNPLNFVNNFSDVSNELLDEMKTELEKGNKEDAIAIAEDVKQNLEKILHHGKRADAIVKGMLQHSRTSSGQKELTDINVLADEYLRLAFHGLRAKDKSFNAKFETDFDSSIEKINVIPQDIGRVILNLINNAFYAVTEKKRQVGDGYEATVTVSTKNLGNKVEVKVKDNGNGIPQKVLDKIFQPFFTTKPTGQGTGLGLSLSYDIVKAHGGEIKVNTKDGGGSEFVIQLPVTSDIP